MLCRSSHLPSLISFVYVQEIKTLKTENEKLKERLKAVESKVYFPFNEVVGSVPPFVLLSLCLLSICICSHRHWKPSRIKISFVLSWLNSLL